MNTQTSAEFNQIIVTRPAQQADSLLKQLGKLADKNIKVNHFPLLTIQPLNFELPTSQKFDGMIFISSHAAQHFYMSDFYTSQDFAPAMINEAKLIAVGDNTAAKIEQLTNRRAIFPLQMNSEGLLQLPQLQSVEGQNWLIVKGQGGRQIISETLNQRGAKVYEVEVYLRKLPALDCQKEIIKAQKENPLWLITSAEALTNLHRILGLSERSDHNTRIIISSDRLAQLAKKKGFSIISQSAGASESQLIECVNRLTAN